MSVRPVWTQLALALACSVWGTSGLAQGLGAGKPAQQPQARPAPVGGQIGSDPAAVALRPASTQRTSTAVQVPAPANASEPLLPPPGQTPAAQQHAQPVDTAGAPTPSSQHPERTQGVKKPRKTEPQKLAGKTTGKPRHSAGKRGVAHDKDSGGGHKKNEKAVSLASKGKPLGHAAGLPHAGTRKAAVQAPAKAHSPAAASKAHVAKVSKKAAAGQHGKAAVSAPASTARDHALAPHHATSTKIANSKLHKKPGQAHGGGNAKPRHPASTKVVA